MNLTDAQLTLVLTYVAPSLVVGVVAIVSSLLTFGFAEIQRNSQWVKQEKSQDKARQLAAAEKEQTFRLDTARQLRSMYGDAIADLSALTLYRDGQAFALPDYRDQSARSEKSLAIVIASLFDRSHPIAIELRAAFLEKTGGRRSNIDQIMRLLLELASIDPRIDMGTGKADESAMPK